MSTNLEALGKVITEDVNPTEEEGGVAIPPPEAIFVPCAKVVLMVYHSEGVKWERGRKRDYNINICNLKPIPIHAWGLYPSRCPHHPNQAPRRPCISASSCLFHHRSCIDLH